MSLHLMQKKLCTASVFSVLSLLSVQQVIGAETGVIAGVSAINDVSADLPGQMDNATSLGRELNSSLRRISESAVKSNQQAVTAPGKARAADAVATDLPPVGTPTLTRAPRRSAPAAVASASALKPVYTPDFSRQKMSFAQLIGQENIDLPNFNEALGSLKNSNGVNISPDQIWTLTDIVTEGLAFSPVFTRAQAQLDTAEARRNQARADMLPTLSTSMKDGYARVETEGLADKKSHSYSTSLTRLVQPIYNQTFLSNLTSTRLSEQSAHYSVEGARESVILSLIQATSSLAATRVVIGFADEQEEQLNEVFHYLEMRAQAGASSNADLERARTRVLAARQNRIELQANYKSALYEVERLLGETPKALRLPYLNQLPSLPQTKDDMRRLMSEYNADLKSLKADVEAQDSVVSAEYGKMMPSFALSAEHDVQKDVSGPTARQTDKRLVLTMNWAVSLGGKEIYGAQEAKAELRSRETKYQEERKRLEQMLEADFALLQSTTQRIATGEAEQRSAEVVVNAVREQLQLGRVGSLLDALDAFDRLFSARSRQVYSLSQQMIAQAQLLSLIGMLSSMTSAAPLPSEQSPQSGVSNNARLSSLHGN